MLGFTVAMLIELMLSMGLTVELYFKCEGNRTLVKKHTWDDIRFRLGPIFVLYLAAVVIAAVQFAQAQRLGHGHGVHTAIERASWDLQDLPMTLTMAAYVARFILSGLRKFTMRNKEREVPSNIGELNLNMKHEMEVESFSCHLSHRHLILYGSRDCITRLLD